MAAFKTLVDDVLTRLNDDGTLFSRAEVLRWLSEGYRRITNQAQHARTFTALEVPPRHHTAITQPWEAPQTATSRKWTFTHQNGQRECTFLWEAQQADEVTPTAGLRAVSQLWELSIGSGQADAHYRFSLPKNESIIYTVWHDHERLGSVTAQVLDSLEDKWWAIDGEPFLWHQTLGDTTDFEVFQIETEYQQSYRHVNGDAGGPRGFSGDRSYSVESGENGWGYAYSWNGESTAPSTQLTGIGRRFTFGPEADTRNSNEGGFFYTHDWEGQAHRGEDITASTAVVETNPRRYDPSVDPPVETTVDIEVGIFREALSPDRQYFPSGQWQVFGLARIFASSENNILVWHAVVPEDTITEETLTPLIPDQVQKYLIYYALGILFNRQGEGFDPALAEHYRQRAVRGLVLLQKLGNVTRVAVSYQRGVGRDTQRRGNRLPQLPPDFPRAPWLR